MNLVKKRDGRIKARCAADGSKQRRIEGYVKSDTTSPTVHNKSVFITAAIDTHYDRDAMILDTIWGIFTCTDKRQSRYVVKGITGRDNGPDQS